MHKPVPKPPPLPTTPPASTSASRCCDARNAPQKLHWATVGVVIQLPLRELEDALKAAIPDGQLLEVLTWLDATFDRVERCEVTEPKDVKRVRQEPPIWEFRVDLSESALLDGALLEKHLQTAVGGGPLIRIYETELDELPGHVVALVSHVKIIAPTDAKTKQLQTSQIRRAETRFQSGRSASWGIEI